MRFSSGLLAAALWVTACTAPAAQQVCHPVSSWMAPAFECPAETALASEVNDAEDPSPQPGEPESDDATAVAPIPVTPSVAVTPPMLPKATATQDSIEISEPIEFEAGSHRLTPRSKAILDEVAAILRSNRGILKLQVEGYTDSKASHAVNRSISTGRAKAVRKYLINKGIAAHRLTAKGLGEKSPIASNATEDGRRRNRRVVFRILKRR